MSNELNPAKKHSKVLTEGPSRAAARSYLRGVGFSKEDLHKPIIGVANTWTEIGPCNFHLRDVYRGLLGTSRDGRFELGAPDSVGTYSIDEALGQSQVYSLWRSANACGDPGCRQHGC